MLRAWNSPIHRNPPLLCVDLGRGTQTINRNLVGYPADSQYLEQSGSGERPSFSNPTFMSSIEDPAMSFSFSYPVDPTVTEYYVNPLPTWTSRSPQLTYDRLVAGSGLTTDVYDPMTRTFQPLDASADFTRMSYYPLVAPQPPTPPAAPVTPMPSNLGFHYHLCRWMGGPQCDGFAPGRNREMAEHLRACHHFLGHERDLVLCEWENCGRSLQRMNVARHIVSRHLLAAANCRLCGRPFSRPDVVGRHERTCNGVPLV